MYLKVRNLVKSLKIGNFLMVSAVLFSSKPLMAEEGNLGDRFKLVGVISDDDRPGNKKGVVVLKDIKNGVTMTLRTGDRIPYENSLRILAVMREKVLMGDDVQKAEISYYGSFDTPRTNQNSDPLNTALNVENDDMDPIDVNQILLKDYSPVELLSNSEE